MASLVQKGKYYYIRIRLKGGREKTISTKTSNRREAQRRLRIIEDQEILLKTRLIEESQLIDVDLRGAADRFLQDRKEKGLRPNTIKAYRHTFHHFFESVSPQMPVKTLSEAHIKAFVSSLHGKKTPRTNKTFSPGAINVNIRQINAFTAWLKKNKYTLYDLKHDKMKIDKSAPKFLTPEELDKIYGLCQHNERMYKTLKVYEGLGLRLSELHHSRREGDFIIIEAAFTKGRRQREIPIPPDLIESYDYAMQHLYNPTTLSHQFKKLLRKAGVDERKTFHSLRHTYALRMLMRTNNVYYVQQLLGHQNIETTMIYTKFSPDLLRSVLKVHTQEFGSPMPWDN